MPGQLPQNLPQPHVLAPIRNTAFKKPRLRHLCRFIAKILVTTSCPGLSHCSTSNLAGPVQHGPFEACRVRSDPSTARHLPNLTLLCPHSHCLYCLSECAGESGGLGCDSVRVTIPRGLWSRACRPLGQHQSTANDWRIVIRRLLARLLGFALLIVFSQFFNRRRLLTEIADHEWHRKVVQVVSPRNLHDCMERDEIITRVQNANVAFAASNINKLITSLVTFLHMSNTNTRLTYLRRSSTTSDLPEIAAVSMASRKSLSCFESVIDFSHRLFLR